MWGETLYTIARSQMRDRYAEAARRAFLDTACHGGSARAALIVAIGITVVRIGERIAGERYLPEGSLTRAHVRRA